MSGHYIERWECGHVAGQCRCPGPKEERTRPGKCPECATPPDQPAMPEREMWWLNPEEDGTMIVVDHPVASFPLAIRLVPESRLREVEARLREVEAERDALARHIERRADGMDLLTQALRAERDALLPLARAGLNAYDYVLAKEQYGNATVPLLDRVSIDESLSAARAILDRVDQEAK